MTATAPATAATATTPEATPAPAAPVAITLPLSPPANLRDLGGIAISGGTTRADFAWRADDRSPFLGHLLALAVAS